MAKPTTILNFIFFLICIHSFSQPDIEWIKTYGGSNWDIGHSICSSSDGGYYVAGVTKSNDGDVSMNHGDYDNWVIKIDNNGLIVWEKCFGSTGTTSWTDIIETSDGGCIFSSSSNVNNGDITDNHGSSDFWVVKLNAMGIVEWQKSYGGTFPEEANSITSTADGGYLIAGYSESTNGNCTNNNGLEDFWIIKINEFGNLIWQKSYGGFNKDEAASITSTNDGGCIVVGFTSSNNGDVTGNHGNSDIWVLNLDINGNIVWKKTIGGNSSDGANKICKLNDGSFIIGGSTNTMNNGDITTNIYGGIDCLITKINDLGQILWTKTYGGSQDDMIYDMIQLSNGQIAFCGVTRSNNTGNVGICHGEEDFWVVALNNIGDIQWNKVIGGTNSDYAQSLIETDDNGLLVVGQNVSSNGDFNINYGAYDLSIVKLGQNSGISNIFNSKPLIFPNPTTGTFKIEIEGSDLNSNYTIIDELGNILTEGIVNKQQSAINLSCFTNGIYFIKIGDYAPQKIILNKNY